MENTHIIELESGEFIGVHVIEVTKIPSFTVISNEYIDVADAEIKYRASFSSLVTEIHQRYTTFQSQDSGTEVSIEFLWMTVPVDNQPYKARIRPFLILRSLSSSRELAAQEIDRLESACTAGLRLNRYGYESLNHDIFKSALDTIEEEKICAIVKDEWVEHLQNHMLPQCYAYDRLNAFSLDLSTIIDSLINHPYSAVSFELIPTHFNFAETTSLTEYAQLLSTLSKGVLAEGLGTMSVSAAENISETYRYYQNNRNSALFLFNIIIWGDALSVDDISAKVYSMMTHDTTIPVNLKQIDVGDVNVYENFFALPWVAQEIICSRNRNREIWSNNTPYANFYRLPYVITAEEASGFFRLPIGTQRISAGLPIDESSGASKTYGENLINAGDIAIGKLKSSEVNTIGISLRDLAKHMLVVGTPGSGKTTFSISLLDRLWKEHKIPFLVIEPAKNEYRALIQSIPELQVFTPGKNYISPFVFNPFVPPKNVKLETYKSTLKTAFAAAVSMSTPLDKIFEESINNCYSDFRWLDTYTIDDKGLPFNISDFIKCFQNTFDEIGYTGDARNIGRAGVVRLNSLINLFDNYFSIPIQDLLEKPTVIELAAIENSDEKALIISLVLLSILAYVNSNYIGEGGLKNVILLEEAHVLLDSDSKSNQGEADPSAIAQGLLKRMLAEIRSYGVGIVVADQSPRKVSSDVVALTDIKMVFRLVEAVDKQIVADSMNMSESQSQRMSRLKPGEALLFFNRLDEPEEVQTPDYRLENNINITLSDEGIRELSSYWNDKKEQLRPYPECAKTPYCNSSCDYARRILAKEIARRIFVKNFRADDKGFETIKSVFGKISTLVKTELNDEEFSRELLSCVKVHLWRRIIYGTRIPVSDVTIEASLIKE